MGYLVSGGYMSGQREKLFTLVVELDKWRERGVDWSAAKKWM